jgi:hypothetical protein
MAYARLGQFAAMTDVAVHLANAEHPCGDAGPMLTSLCRKQMVPKDGSRGTSEPWPKRRCYPLLWRRFTSSCLGYEFDGTLGVGAHLLGVLNAEIVGKIGRAGYKQLPNAASKYKELAGEYGLMSILKSRFMISNLTQDMCDVISFPWRRIYTTDFDNGIELASSRAKRKIIPFNNTDDPIDQLPSSAVIHLHGSADRWDIQNFDASCILDATSYARLPSIGKWLEHLRIDLERASAVVFVGFSASDFHLN